MTRLRFPRWLVQLARVCPVGLIALALSAVSFAAPATGTLTALTTPPAPVPLPLTKLSYPQDAPLSAKPYWKSKPDLLRRMKDDRYITVSVNRDETPGHTVFTMAGAGDVARDKDACVKLSQNYPQLKEVSDHFKTITFDEKVQKLFVIVEALGFQARMLMQLTPVHDDWRDEIQFEVIWGSFKGMKGVIGFERLAPRLTEVSFNGRFEAPKSPLPKFVMGFALEVIAQKVAEKMRTYLESHLP